MDVYIAGISGTMSTINRHGVFDIVPFKTNVIIEEREDQWAHIRNEIAPEALVKENKNFNKIVTIKLDSWKRSSFDKLIKAVTHSADMGKALEH